MNPAALHLTLLISLSLGEPINPEAWRWYNENVGGGKCSVVDTYWQTETGAHIAVNLPGTTHSSLALLSISSTTEDNLSFPSIFTGVMPTKPGSCGLPYYGIEFAVLEPVVSILNLRHVHYASA